MKASNFFIKKSSGINLNVTTINILSEDNFIKYKDKIDLITLNILNLNNFTGLFGEKVLIYTQAGELKEVFVGSGSKKIYLALAEIISFLPEGVYSVSNEFEYLIALYWGMQQYQFNRYRSSKNLLKKLIVADQHYQDLVIELDIIFQIRNLINLPANVLGPVALSAEVEKLALKFSGQYSEIIGEQLLEKNFSAIYAVGKAAYESPRLSKLIWGQENDPLIVIIGKGVCFDSGGLDLKSSSNMRLMKKDMGGAANAIGLANWIMEKKLPVQIMLLIPAVENAIDGNSYRPGDVIKMHNGLHVEIDNTDAEGRLIMADCLSYASQYMPDLLIDLSTLTGAARVAVGPEISAVFANNFSDLQKLVGTSQEIADMVWPLPMYDGYNDYLKSYIADCTNSSPSSYAGAITAALFLNKFVDQKISWLHFDFMAWNISSKPGRPEGGEAMAIRTIFKYIQKRYTRV